MRRSQICPVFIIEFDDMNAEERNDLALLRRKLPTKTELVKSMHKCSSRMFRVARDSRPNAKPLSTIRRLEECLKSSVRRIVRVPMWAFHSRVGKMIETGELNPLKRFAAAL